MNDPMRILKADHKEVKDLLTKLADSEEGAEREAMVSELEKKLTAHMDLEESLIYPEVVSRVGDEDGEEAEIEHGLARDGLATMVGLVDRPGFGAAVEMLKAGILHHVEEEETELLPELKEAMSREEWAALGDDVVSAKDEAGVPVASPPKRRSTKRKTSATKTSSSNKKASAKASK